MMIASSAYDSAPVNLDDMAMRLQEDFAVLQVNEQGGNRLAYLNVCMPSGWAPEDKIGKPFDAVQKFATSRSGNTNGLAATKKMTFSLVSIAKTNYRYFTYVAVRLS